MKPREMREDQVRYWHPLLQYLTSVKRFVRHFQEKFAKLVGGHVKFGVELFKQFLLQTAENEEVKSFNTKFQLVPAGTYLEELLCYHSRQEGFGIQGKGNQYVLLTSLISDLLVFFLFL